MDITNADGFALCETYGIDTTRWAQATVTVRRANSSTAKLHAKYCDQRRGGRNEFTLTAAELDHNQIGNCCRGRISALGSQFYRPLFNDLAAVAEAWEHDDVRQLAESSAAVRKHVRNTATSIGLGDGDVVTDSEAEQVLAAAETVSERCSELSRTAGDSRPKLMQLAVDDMLIQQAYGKVAARIKHTSQLSRKMPIGVDVVRNTVGDCTGVNDLTMRLAVRINNNCTDPHGVHDQLHDTEGSWWERTIKPVVDNDEFKGGTVLETRHKLARRVAGLVAVLVAEQLVDDITTVADRYEHEPADTVVTFSADQYNWIRDHNYAVEHTVATTWPSWSGERSVTLYIPALVAYRYSNHANINVANIGAGNTDVAHNVSTMWEQRPGMFDTYADYVDVASHL